MIDYKPKDSPRRKCEMDDRCDLGATECRMFATWAFPRFRQAAKAELLESYREARAAYESYIRGKTAISLLHTSSNAECREIARQMEELFR